MQSNTLTPTTFEAVEQATAGVPNMSPDEGRSIYRHLVDSGARDVLELGTAHGVSAAYMAAAMVETGGRVVTVDHVVPTARRDPAPDVVLDRAGVTHLVERVLVRDSSYTWWLKEQVERRSDGAGNVEPAFDFCYLDGAHNWTIDGMSVFLVEKLLRPLGWLLLDDLPWKYDDASSSFGPGQGPDALGLSEEEQREPHVQAVFDLVVRQHPSFTTFRVQNEVWGWAQKNPGAPRRSETVEVAPSIGVRAKRLARRLGVGV
jgi:predicted O-methyltransferase YrrM